MIEEAESYATLAVEGRLDTNGSCEIEQKLIDRLSEKSRHLLIDVSAVDFIGSMGIRVFVRAASALVRKQRKLILFAPQPHIEKTLAVSDCLLIP